MQVLFGSVRRVQFKFVNGDNRKQRLFQGNEYHSGIDQREYFKDLLLDSLIKNVNQKRKRDKSLPHADKFDLVSLKMTEPRSKPFFRSPHHIAVDDDLSPTATKLQSIRGQSFTASGITNAAETMQHIINALTGTETPTGDFVRSSDPEIRRFMQQLDRLQGVTNQQLHQWNQDYKNLLLENALGKPSGSFDLQKADKDAVRIMDQATNGLWGVYDNVKGKLIQLMPNLEKKLLLSEPQKPPVLVYARVFPSNNNIHARINRLNPNPITSRFKVPEFFDTVGHP